MYHFFVCCGAKELVKMHIAFQAEVSSEIVEDLRSK
jgi:hypothetical protein